MTNKMRLPFRLTKGAMFIAMLLLLALVVPACKSTGGGGPDRACTNEEKLALENTCFAATALTQGSPFPNPVQTGGTVKLKMKIGGVNSQYSPIPAVISTRVLSSVTGALVTQQTQPAIQPSSNFQDVPIWTNIAVAPGIYVLEVTVNLGDCGFKRICLSGEQRIVVQ